MLTIPIAEAIVGGLGRANSKMPCCTHGIGVSSCITGNELRETGNLAFTCAHCWAHRGRFPTHSVKTANERRLAALKHPLWADAMVVLINAYERGRFFRWFQDGDLQSIAMLDKILWVARRTSSVRHWLPTLEWGMVNDHPGIACDGLPANMVIRVSSRLVEEPADIDWPTTSSTHRWPGEPVPVGTSRRNSVECPAYMRDDACGPCRACWAPKVRNVSYLLNAGLRKNAAKLRGVRSKRLTVARSW